MKQYDQVMLRKGVRDPSLISEEFLSRHPDYPKDYRIDDSFPEGRIERLRFDPSNGKLNFEGHRIDVWYRQELFQPVEEWLNENTCSGNCTAAGGQPCNKIGCKQ